MEIVADASAFLAVVLDETHRKWVIEKTSGFGPHFARGPSL